MTMNRKAGWYWVKWPHEKEWHAARYIGRVRERHMWSSGDIIQSDAPALIGPRIPTPEDQANTYLQAADEMLVVAGIGTAEPEDDLGTAKRKLGELIDWHVAVALDERVNGGYRLVPVEPTPDMLFALDAGRAAYGSMRGGYRAMLEAARRATDGP